MTSPRFIVVEIPAQVGDPRSDFNLSRDLLAGVVYLLEQLLNSGPDVPVDAFGSVFIGLMGSDDLSQPLAKSIAQFAEAHAKPSHPSQDLH